MKFVVITKSLLDFIPPVISVSLILRDLGHDVHVITSGASPTVEEKLKSRNISMDVLPYTTATNPAKKVWEYIMFRRETVKLLKTLSFDILWIEGAITIRSLGESISKYPYILQISELHETSKPQLRSIGKVINDAKLVFMPEYNRTVLYQIWFNLKNRPITLPNKPYFIPAPESMGYLKEKYSSLLEPFRQYKVILFQGMIFPERDLSNYITAIKELGRDYKLVLLGKDENMLSKYRQIDESIIHIDFIPAPDYLVFTSLCHFGIVTYDPRKLNTAYCAPNKIYEYSAFGKPMIGNNIPGLNCLEHYKAGVLVDESSVCSIQEAIIQLDNNYEDYSLGAKKLFKSTDNNRTIKQSLERIR